METTTHFDDFEKPENRITKCLAKAAEVLDIVTTDFTMTIPEKILRTF